MSNPESVLLRGVRPKIVASVIRSNADSAARAVQYGEGRLYPASP
jgi:hypothetical protein